MSGRDTPVKVSLTRVRTKRYGNPSTKETKLTTFAGVGPEANVSFFKNSLHNLATAIEARVFRRKVGNSWEYVDSTPHSTGIYFLHKTDFERVFKENVSPIAPYTVKEFIETYKGRRKRVYENALKSLSGEPLNEEDADCKCFLKKEKDIASDKPDAIPRVITFPHPRYGLSFGCYVKPIEHGLFTTIDLIFNPDGDIKTVMKGLNYIEVAQEIVKKRDIFTNPWSVDGDVSRLDSSLSEESHYYYYYIASQFYEGQDKIDFMNLAMMQLNRKVKGKADDGSVSYDSSGLGSGQMNTSQMGVLIVCHILYCLKEKYKMDLQVVNCGDDFTVIGERQTVMKFIKVSKKFFAKYNLVLKLEEPVDYIEGINFCQSNPVYIGDVYRMVRNPRRAVIKDSTSIDNLRTTNERVKFMHAISCTGIATHGGVPILQDVYAMFGRNAVNIRKGITSKRGLKKSFDTTLKDNSMKYWGKNLNAQYGEINTATRLSFFLAFGIDPATQILIERKYRTISIGDKPSRNLFDDQCPW